MNVTLRQLEAFANACRYGSLTRAAAEMHLTQSAVSLLVRQLEDAWQVRLFDRTTRALNPTQAAKEALAPVERILGDVKSTAQRMRSLHEMRAGRVVFAVTAAVASALMPRVLLAFRRDYPDITIDMIDVSADQLTAKILAGEAEFGIGTVENDSPEIVLETLIRDQLSAIGLRDGTFENRKAISWSELARFPTISVRVGISIRTLIDSSLAAHGKTFVPILETSLLNTALSMTAHGLGLSILPAYLVPLLQFPNLAAVPLVDPVVFRNLSLIRRTGRSLSPAASRFLLAVKAEIAAVAANK